MRPCNGELAAVIPFSLRQRVLPRVPFGALRVDQETHRQEALIRIKRACNSFLGVGTSDDLSGKNYMLAKFSFIGRFASSSTPQHISLQSHNAPPLSRRPCGCRTRYQHACRSERSQGRHVRERSWHLRRLRHSAFILAVQGQVAHDGR